MSGIDDDDLAAGLDLELLNDSDGEGVGGSNSKECTGRWTREEHQLFVKGLELYGKGWKKIASLIKTRTVVQIRTHAQKYFLKLSKARQNGDISGGMSIDGRPLYRKKRKRKSNRPVAVAPPLQPFIKVPNSTDPHEVDDGIYNFLSPTLDSIETKRLVVTREKTDDKDDKAEPTSAARKNSIGNEEDLPPKRETANQGNDDSPSANADGNNSTAPATVSKFVLRSALKQVRPTEWYQKGQNVLDLIREAEKLDWSEDVKRFKRERTGSSDDPSTTTLPKAISNPA